MRFYGFFSVQNDNDDSDDKLIDLGDDYRKSPLAGATNTPHGENQTSPRVTENTVRKTTYLALENLHYHSLWFIDSKLLRLCS